MTEINRHVAATLKLCGPAVLSPSNSSSASTPLEQTTAHLLLILQKQHPCQKDEDELDDTEVPDEESAEYDWLVIETALEVVASLASALGEQFGQLWKIFETPIMKFASAQEKYERSAAVGTIGECVEAMGAACTPYTKRMMAVLSKRLRDEDVETRSNAAFSTGQLCLHSTDAKEILPNYGTILATLEPMLDIGSSASADETEARLVDNAAGCVSRMIKKAPSNVPLEEVLTRLVELLPLKNDFRENEPVFDMIISLYQAQNSVIQGLTPKLMPVFEKVLGPPEDQLSDGTKEKVTQLVQYLR